MGNVNLEELEQRGFFVMLCANLEQMRGGAREMLRGAEKALELLATLQEQVETEDATAKQLPFSI